MVTKRLAGAALCAVLVPSAEAGIESTVVPHPAPTVTLQAIVGVGTTSACGMREAPHLIEHLVLSSTEYGESPVDAILSLRSKGITLSALTRSDFTQFTLVGPADKSDQMEKALMTFLGRASLPKAGFEREKHAILNELRASESYTSSPSFYERFIAVSAGGAEPCVADQKPFLSYDLGEVQSVYERFYTASNIKLIAMGKPTTFNLKSIASAISRAPGTRTGEEIGKRENAKSIRLLGSNDKVEIIFPIAGRQDLPEDAANAYADQARLELQAHIRREFQLYTARSFVDQSIRGGWIRLEVPGISAAKADDLVAVATKAMGMINSTEYGADPVWQAHGYHRVNSPIGTPIVSEVDQHNGRWLPTLNGVAVRFFGE